MRSLTQSSLVTFRSYIHFRIMPTRYLCINCTAAVKTNQQGIMCSGCDRWLRARCVPMESDLFVIWSTRKLSVHARLRLPVASAFSFNGTSNCVLVANLLAHRTSKCLSVADYELLTPEQVWRLLSFCPKSVVMFECMAGSTWTAFFQHLATALDGCVKFPVFGTDDERALTSSVDAAFKNCHWLTCTRHLRENCNRQLQHNLGHNDQQRNAVIHTIFGDGRLASVTDEVQFNIEQD